MTSFPPAVKYAVGAVKSILRGSLLPDKLVLYLTLADFGEGDLPQELIDLERENSVFEIRDYGRDIRSYRKLVPALTDFPDSIIVTVDDDVDYHPDMLKELVEWHSRYPDRVIAHRAKRIRPGHAYKKWSKFRWYDFVGRRDRAGFDVIQTGVAGVLYPPHSLRKDMIDAELFTALAPTADDLWFWAAAVANGRAVMPVPFGRNKPRSLGKPRALSLKTVNFKTGIDRNLEALNAILARYPEIHARLCK